MAIVSRFASDIVEAAVQYRRIGNVLLQILLIAAANYIAFWLRFDGDVPASSEALRLNLVPALLLVRTATFLPFRLYEGAWRHTGWWDLRNIIAGVAVSSGIFYLLTHVAMTTGYPRSVVITDSLLLVFMMAGVRVAGRAYRELLHVSRHRRVLICGAGDAGAMLAREMRQHYDYLPVAFVDDDRRKSGQRIHGVPVVGTSGDLASVIARYQPEEVLIAMPGAGPAAIRRFVEALRPFKLLITTTPGSRDIIDGKVTVAQVRPLEIADLLTRTPVTPQPALVAGLIRGRRVLVTGAGGSIGSELCRQIAALGPSVLVLFDRYENALYEISTSLTDLGMTMHRSVIGDITDLRRVDAVFAEHRPEIVFHAAAHKHVPMMEENPCEAVKNNVAGTRILAQAADAHGVTTFVLISTDKAVNPTSVMGAAKRVAELILRARPASSRTSYITVRFGNVLASNGSVVPRFLRQIREGGPVTVTHPEITRYFMLIPEAVHLVLQAAASGQAGSTYVLEMGEQIRLADMARTLIRLCGFVPDEDIRVEYVGLRAGEKLAEELVASGEHSQPSGVDHIQQVISSQSVDAVRLAARIHEMETAAGNGDVPSVMAMLKTIVPEYTVTAGGPPPSVTARPEPVRDEAGAPVPAKRVRFA